MSEAVLSLPEGYRLRHYEVVCSSNDEAKTLARSGEPAGAIVWADRQTAGRGRRGRVWTSPPGNLYFSLLLRPDAPPARIAQLSFVAALGLGEALGELAGAALEWRCKWPNDLLVNGKKLAGILIESETSAGGRIDFVVIGIGVNLRSRPENTEFPATSLAAEGIAGVSPADLLAAFLRHFDLWCGRWREAGFSPVREAWLRRAAGLGEPTRVRLERTTLTGRFLDLDADGALVLDAADGRRKIAAGEVFPLQAAPAPSVLRDAGFAGSSA
jgi:BirA family biotin operon repressor/biotin-[acetyl-CoA-carboxylase] ligase